MNEYRRNNARYTQKVRKDEYILVNRVAREKLNVEVDEIVNLILN